MNGNNVPSLLALVKRVKDAIGYVKMGGLTDTYLV